MQPYDPADYPPVAVTVDVVLLTIHDDALAALLIRRGGEPFLGSYALPGGFIQPRRTSTPRPPASWSRRPARKTFTWNSSAATARPAGIRGCEW